MLDHLIDSILDDLPSSFIGFVADIVMGGDYQTNDILVKGGGGGGGESTNGKRDSVGRNSPYGAATSRAGYSGREGAVSGVRDSRGNQIAGRTTRDREAAALGAVKSASARAGTLTPSRPISRTPSSAYAVGKGSFFGSITRFTSTGNKALDGIVHGIPAASTFNQVSQALAGNLVSSVPNVVGAGIALSRGLQALGLENRGSGVTPDSGRGRDSIPSQFLSTSSASVSAPTASTGVNRFPTASGRASSAGGLPNPSDRLRSRAVGRGAFGNKRPRSTTTGINFAGASRVGKISSGLNF